MAVPAQAAESAPTTQTTEAGSGQTGANAQDSSVSSTPDSSSSHPQQDSRGPDYFREAFARVRGYTPAPKSPDSAPQAPPAGGRTGRDTEQDTKSRPGTASSAALAAAAPTAQGQSPVVLTPEELQRRVQSEADRLLAKRQADERAQREREEERELRQTNPFEYVRRIEAREQEQRETEKEAAKAVDLLSQQLTLYDRNILDPIVGALADTTRKKILESVQGDGIPGRQKIASEAISALRTQWIAEGRDTARANLMKDPSFIKEVLARHGGQREEPETSPATPPGAASRPKTSNEAVNGWMRGAAQQTRFQP